MPPKSKKNQGFQSAAGLIRYFDSESEKGPVLKPTYIVAAIVMTIAVVLIAGAIWPT
ncbi:preprotein translocase subunit SecG [Methanomassiliicoccales archaeon RumEn M1]|jgi:preprotein translocase subunit Sec61beta|nr:preprotein translocase subunit SecG [Methanomassiliicoccales archaeon RumEn M1]